MQDILLIDNYDSFTYNLWHLIWRSLLSHPLCPQDSKASFNIHVVRRDDLTLNRILKLDPICIFISPGPGHPGESSHLLKLIEALAPQIPLFGVCLGMQAIGQVFGASIETGEPIHGKRSTIYHHGTHALFANVPNRFEVVRYHSLRVCLPSTSTQDKAIDVLATLEKDQTPMALSIPDLPCVWGVQFHPESACSEYGETLVQNFLAKSWYLNEGSDSNSAALLFSSR